MKVAILGFAGQGQSSFEYWNKPENEITILDLKETTEVPQGAASRLGKNYLKNLNEFDIIVRTPIIHPRDIVEANPESPEILGKVTSNTNEFFRVCPTKNIVGVTGTKGKGTTSTLIARMLEAAGKRVHLAGNIGTPPLELLKENIQQDDWVVLELANFQLIDLKESPHIAVCLMVEPEHMDWHEDMDEYIIAKQQLFIHQDEDDIAIYYAKNENSASVADASLGLQIPYMQAPGAEVIKDKITIDGHEIVDVSELKLLGKHNWQNACAAVTAVWQVSQDVGAIRSVLTSFTGLPFRIEFREEKNGVRYYNDSFASAPDATVAALKSVLGNKVMIVGGFERGLDLSGLAASFKEQMKEIRKVLLIGATAERTAKALESAGFSNYELCTAKDMPSIVRRASELAMAGDAVVLSPGFASFDMFKNFEDRGLKFNEAVERL